MKGKKWKVLYGLFLAVVSCLLYNTLFTLKNANAALVETDAPTSGWLDCDQNTNKDVNWYWGWSSEFILKTRCGSWSEIQQLYNRIIIHRLEIPFSNTDNTYKFKDKDAYALATFSIEIIGSNIVIPTNFVGRNVNVIDTKFDWEDVWGTIRGTDSGGNVTSIGNALYLESASQGHIKASYTLKIRIPKGVEWNGTLDLQTGITFPETSNSIFRILITPVRMAYIYETDADIAAEAQQNQEDRDNIESQSEQTNSDADNAEQQMSSGSGSLISVVTSFSNAMIGVRRTNCKLPRMSAYDFDLGELDLCTYSPPAWVQTITSAVVSLIIVRLAYKIFKRIMGIAKGISK